MMFLITIAFVTLLFWKLPFSHSHLCDPASGTQCLAWMLVALYPSCTSELHRWLLLHPSAWALSPLVSGGAQTSVFFRSCKWLWCVAKFVNIWARYLTNIYWSKLTRIIFLWVYMNEYMDVGSVGSREELVFSTGKLLYYFFLFQWTLWILKIWIDFRGWRASRDKAEGCHGCSQRLIPQLQIWAEHRGASQQFICFLLPNVVTGTFFPRFPDSACYLEVQIN